MSDKPIVIVIDDQPKQCALDVGRSDVLVRVISPEDLEEDHLRDAHLVLVDQVLDEWVPDPEPPYACQPADGLALAGIVRAHMRRLACPPAAVALYSGNLEQLAKRDPQEHLVAMAFGLEWAFAKNAKNLDLQVGALAKAVNVLPRAWVKDDSQALVVQLSELFGLRDEPWATRAVAELVRCRPPLHELSDWTDGLAVLRWVLHRVLPYPCCLLGIPELALRLRVEPKWLADNLESGQKLQRAVASAQYAGALQQFLGARWWWAGWEHLMRAASGVMPNSLEEVHDWLSKEAGLTAKGLETSQPVLTYDANGRFVSIEARQACVRIQPDDWPGYADEPWCLVAAARGDAALRRLVIPADLSDLELGD